MNIKIRKYGKQIFFEQLKETPDRSELNVTNIWDFREIIFDEKKLHDDFIHTFLKELFQRENIETISIEKIEMCSIIFDLISDIPCIHKVIIKENHIIPSNLYQALAKLHFVKYLECYQMTSFLFEECTNRLKIEVIDRKKEFVKSNFMLNNDLTTHSKIFYKKKIAIYDTYTKDDLLDLDYFLTENKNLSQVDFYSTKKELLKDVLIKLLINKKKNIHIIIYQKEEEKNELEEMIESIGKRQKEELLLMNISLEIRYTKKYKEKNILKQLNLNLFRIILMIMLILTTSIYIISKFHIYTSEKETKKIENLTEETKVPVEENEENESSEEKETKQENTNEKVVYEKNMDTLLKINNEFKAWLTIPNTGISYPIVQHSDNKYYLTHSFNKSYNINGWIFIDYRNHTDNFDQNTIIYGHDSTEDIMFGPLKKVLKESWYKNTNNLTITYETKEKKIEAEIFSIYTIDTTNDYLQVVFSDKEFEDFLNKIIKRSIYDFQKEVTIQDKIITLSTCYKNSSKRLVIHAKIKK
jgi:sortase B